MDNRIYGKHVYGSFYDVEEQKIYEDTSFGEQLVKEAVKVAGATLIDIKSWKIEGEKGGISVLALVNESHIAIHTWKEYKYVTIDIYTCGEKADPWKAWRYLKEKLKPKKYTVNYSDRSML